MGCDIHLYVEVKKDGKWKSVDKWSWPYDEIKDVSHKDSYYNRRNYSLFAILADVRNGSGFAGIKTGDGFNIISEPKGVPHDISKEVLEICDFWNGDGHSHSWFTLKELIEFDWTQKTRRIGWVNSLSYVKWDKERDDSPGSFCGGVSGGSIRHLTEDEMNSHLNFIKNSFNLKHNWELIEYIENHEPLKGYYCQVEWEQTYYSCCSEFWSSTIPRLLALGNPEDVRIVFWFDN